MKASFLAMLLEKKPFPWSFRENVKQKKSFAATMLWSLKGVWWESNPWPPEPQPGALPTELQTPYIAFERVKMNRQVSKTFLLSYYHRAIFVREIGLEPTKSIDNGFTVRPRCRWSTPEYFSVEPHGVEPCSQDFQSCAYTMSAKAPILWRGWESNP